MAATIKLKSANSLPSTSLYLFKRIAKKSINDHKPQPPKVNNCKIPIPTYPV